MKVSAPWSKSWIPSRLCGFKAPFALFTRKGLTASQREEKLQMVFRKRFTSDDAARLHSDALYLDPGDDVDTCKVSGVDSFVAPQGWTHPAGQAT